MRFPQLIAVAALSIACGRHSSLAVAINARSAVAVANDNRSAAGATRDGVRSIILDARPAQWQPDADVDSTMTVQAFAEQDGVPRIPGPLIRVTSGTPVRVTVSNSTADSMLVLHGLPTGGDSVVVAKGERKIIEFTAGQPGTYLYWGNTTREPFELRTGRDAQLTGALIVDPAGVLPD